ncbi:hypothetical protein [Acetobacterium wieringae]|uniref:hypothetical protein n=1 Tax=Acetobacterium wieringae TaxID=52694 RepID=UPI0020345F57|nr:hypothetical protein [Acetobacterium wieringae]URN85834.1 hypothetical protein CHL1_001508 [Acetobacterium wieringae]
MRSDLAFANGAANRGKEMMVFDWDKAARLIKEMKPEIASAGLADDWEWTGGMIYDGKPVMDDYTYLSSTWATPEISIDDEVFDCYIMSGQTEWNCATKWPQSALDILEGKNESV